MRYFDASLFDYLYNLAIHINALGAFMSIWTRLSFHLFLVMALIFIIERLTKIHYKDIASLISSIFGGFVVTSTIRWLYARPRPFTYDHIASLIEHDSTPSFPSMHATLAFIVALSIFFIHHKLGIAALFAAFLTALSRVMVGVHFPSDVIAGALIGISIVLIARYFIYRMQKAPVHKKPAL